MWRWWELTSDGRCFQGPRQKSVVLLVSRPDWEEQVKLRDAQIWVEGLAGFTQGWSWPCAPHTSGWSPGSLPFGHVLFFSGGGSGLEEALCSCVLCSEGMRTDCFLSSAPSASGPWPGPGEPPFSPSCFPPWSNSSYLQNWLRWNL